MKLKAKMLLTICPVIIVVFSATITFIAVKSSNMARKNAFSKAEEMAQRYSSIIKARLDKTMNSSRIIAQSIEGFKNSSLTPDPEFMNMMIRQILEKNEDFSGIWVMLDTGKFYRSYYAPWFYRKDNKIVFQPVEDEKGYEEAKINEYYDLPKNSKHSHLLEPYLDPDINILMTSATVPVISGNSCIGVVGIDITLDKMAEIIDNIHPFETGAASLISHSGKYVAHTDKSKLGQMFEDTEQWESALKAVNSGNGFSSQKFSESLKTEIKTIFTPVDTGNPGQPWVLTINIPLNKVLEDSKDITVSCVIMGLFSIAVTAFVLLIFSGTVIAPVNSAIEGIKKIMQGDLTARLDVRSHDEIGDLSMEVNSFVGSLQSIIKQMRMNAALIDGSSEQLSSTSADLHQGIDRSSGMAENIASSTVRMNQNIDAVARNIQTSSGNVEAITSIAREMTMAIGKIRKSTEESKLISEKAVIKSKNAEDRMDELKRSASEIGKVVETIAEISAMTNMLSLNATIEAARAGEAGKGFAVVAGEIKNLASQTADATVVITKLIDGIQSTTAATVSDNDQITTIINEINMITEVITKAVSEQSAVTDEISGNISSTASGIKNVNSAVNHSITVVSEINREIDLVDKETRKMADLSTIVQINAGELKKMAGELKSTVDRFRVA